ncbi:MAG: hypothetical protein WDM77_10260 [Steroidobacteraceae bacterium]
MNPQANWTIRLRRWHAYMGLLIAPSVLFFALTGVLQIFNLHEAHGTYQPALLLEKLSAVHKDQVFEQSHDHPPPDEAPQAGPKVGGAPDEHAADDEGRQDCRSHSRVEVGTSSSSV